ncbi:MAG: polyphosphate kinase [Rhodobacteraceae bacterium]|nr:MAG: polyphosphate kinase [Paracoccaceae bacterium]|tara:strand:+ start:539 stop:1156 length:618 start_codon:yes stop_codon:yes gene_type:complete
MLIDHLVVSGSHLKETCEYVEDSLGVRMEDGGKHKLFGTHNKLLGLNDGLYLECIAVDPSVPKPPYSRWFNLDNFSGNPRLTNWVCSCENLNAKLAKLPIKVGEILNVSRGKLNWEIVVPQSGLLPFDGLFPAFIKWQSMHDHPSKKLKANDYNLSNLKITHPEGEQIKYLLSDLDDKRVSIEVGKIFGLTAEFSNNFGKKVILG